DSEVNETIFVSAMLVTLAIVYVAVSSRVQVLEALREREGHLVEAQRTAGLGNWELNLQTHQLDWSREMYRIVGLDPKVDKPSFDVFASRLYPDDHPKLIAFWDALRKKETHEDLTLRLQVPDGTVRSLRFRGEYAPATSARPERLFGICQDVTVAAERERMLMHAKNVAEHAREEAERAREQAEEMARMKSDFLANMSHEIRTPLTAIIGFAQILGQEVDSKQLDLVEPIEQSGRRLLATLNSVLDLAQLKADGVNLNMERIDVAEEVHELAEMLRSLAKDKGLSLVVHAPVLGLYVNADRGALIRVLTNLISNAIKFTDEGRITVSVEEEDGYILTRVRDTGRGIDPSFLPKLFEEFRQESTGATRTHEGSGLGLAITKGLVELMGGTITVETELNEGTQFTVMLLADQEVAVAEASITPVRRAMA
ncbi:MAG: ATP-binding protein, partial [Rubricoccaceae bacterium]|nr:ATP-binding protein [Rubricoccaceae bacterium]